MVSGLFLVSSPLIWSLNVKEFHSKGMWADVSQVPFDSNPNIYRNCTHGHCRHLLYKSWPEFRRSHISYHLRMCLFWLTNVRWDNMPFDRVWAYNWCSRLPFSTRVRIRGRQTSRETSQDNNCRPLSLWYYSGFPFGKFYRNYHQSRRKAYVLLCTGNFPWNLAIPLLKVPHTYRFYNVPKMPKLSLFYPHTLYRDKDRCSDYSSRVKTCIQ